MTELKKTLQTSQSEINRLNDMEYEYTKLDERIPYGPYRVKNLIAYASSENGMKVI